MRQHHKVQLTWCAVPHTQVEWGSNNLASLFAQKGNALSPAFLRMLSSLPRFETEVLAYLAQGNTDPQPLGDWLAQRGFSASFTDFYLIPVCSSIWSTPGPGIMQADAYTILSFMRNHHMLQVTGRPTWLTVAGRSAKYVAKVVAAIQAAGGQVRTQCSVKAVHHGESGTQPRVTLQTGEELSFDAVVVACHVPEALDVLGAGASAEETEVLSAFEYSTSKIFLHRDATYMPRKRAAWSAWNFISEGAAAEGCAGSGVCLTYWLNTLQNLGDVPFAADPAQQPPPPVLVTLNPASEPQHVVAQWSGSHPVPSRKAALMKRRLPHLNAAAHASASGIYFAGAYAGFGFHEDGVKAGFMAADAVCGVSVEHAAAALLPDEPQLSLTLSARAAKATCVAFLTRFITVGELVLAESAQAPLRFGAKPETSNGVQQKPANGNGHTSNGNGNGNGNSHAVNGNGMHAKAAAVEDPYDLAHCCVASQQKVTIRVRSPAFYWKLATRADMGLCDAYVDGDIEVTPSLTALLCLAIANRDAAAAAAAAAVEAAASSAASQAPLSVMGTAGAYTRGLLQRCGGVATAAIPAALGYAKHLARGNSLTQARRNIAAHYDLSNDLFQAFLSPDMTYSCAIFVSPTESLESAQERKLRALADKARLRPGMHVLEIGFGWGSMSLLLAKQYGCRVTGITLSEQQLELATRRVTAAGLSHMIDFQLCDYRAHKPASGAPYDAIISCEMLEAVGHEYLGTYFVHVARLLSSTGVAVIQVITTPEGRYEVYRTSTDFIKEYIFPGCCCPSLTAVLGAAGESNLTLAECDDIGVHYAPTLLRWRHAFMDAKSRITGQMGFSDSFIRAWDLYFQYCAAGFATRTLGDWQLVFTRPGNVAGLGNVSFAHASSK